MNWYVIYTKPKKEDMVSEMLRHGGIEVYNPKLRLIKYAKGRYREVVEPLFPCYIFARFAPETHLWMISYTRGVRRAVGGENGLWHVAEDIIDFIRSREQDGFITSRSMDIREGDKVKVTDGPFAGLTGIFERQMTGSERVVLLLAAVEYQARVFVDRASLIKVS
jgi:transcriptional antiterminator RfaH